MVSLLSLGMTFSLNKPKIDNPDIFLYYSVDCQVFGAVWEALLMGIKNGAEKDFENSAPNPYYYPKKTFT